MSHSTRRSFLAASTAAVLSGSLASAAPAKHKLVLIAGTPSHGPGQHEHNAGVLLFQKCLAGVKDLDVQIVLNGYPKDDALLDTADGIVVYADGGGGHPLVQGNRLERINALMRKGVGLFCCHFAVEVVKGKAGDAFRDWIGGCYEHQWSCNPMWKAEFKELPRHPICNGVQPFTIHDEWYFNMRFRPEMQGVTPILTASPTDATRDGPYVYPRGPYKHIQEAKGRPEHVMWATQRKDGGRGAGFTGGHFHRNWKDDNFRKVVLNTMLWVAKVDVPAEGVASTVSDADMAKNLDPKGKK
ncbi:MAG: ThuA domain-containing protein [Gemmataceae bacterium]